MSTSVERLAPQDAPDVRGAADSSLIQRARQRDTEALTTMFRQFIPPEEQIVAVEYLGSLGLFFKTHSFASVSERRVASLLVRARGQVTYRDGAIESINSAVLHQPARSGIFGTLLSILSLGAVGKGRGPNRKTVGLVLWVGEGLSVPIVTHRKMVTRANAIYRAVIQTRERRLAESSPRH